MKRIVSFKELMTVISQAMCFVVMTFNYKNKTPFCQIIWNRLTTYVAVFIGIFISLFYNSEMNADTVIRQNDTDNLSIIDILDDEYEKESEMFKGGHVCVSEDKRIKIESGICPGGGAAPDYWAKWTIVNDKGTKCELRFENSPYISDIHSLHKTSGSTYYIASCYSKASIDGYKWLNAYKIVGDTIKEVNVVDGNKVIDDNEFEINYCISVTNGAGFDWLFEYDTKNKNLYVPIIENREVLDRYQVWHFDGERFVCLGEKPHKDMHESLGKYNCLILYFTTKDYLVRVDSLDSRELRYASWKKPKTMADKPDLVIKGGKRQQYPAAPDELERCDDYRFTNGNYEYLVNYCEITLPNNGYGRHQDYLLVKKNGKVILKQEESIE